MTLDQILAASKDSSRAIGRLNTDQKNEVLKAMMGALDHGRDEILKANQVDLSRGRDNGLSGGLTDRLTLTDQRIDSLISAIDQIVSLPDPVGQVVQGKTLPNGIRLQQVRVPFGVIGAIYEARPNVTVDIAALALKGGNSVLLRGGSAAQETNLKLVELLQRALLDSGIPASVIQTVDEYGREGAVAMMHARGIVDVLIPRGSANLIRTVVEESKVPVIETGDGVVHMFVDQSADEEMAIDLVHNSKTQRVSVCNALETLLVHRSVAPQLLPSIARKLTDSGVTIHGCPETLALVPAAIAAEEADWSTEYYSLDLSVKVVNDLDQALEHINRYSTRHTDTIVTNDVKNADRFLAEVDSAVVMVNASTRFTDGGEFGFGAEVGISTQKLHARGPMGLSELTSTKWQVRGSGQVRK